MRGTEEGAGKEWVLSGCRVLDLSDESGFLAGKILADLGADVVKVEPPGGAPSRKIGPFYGDEAHPERSLYWAAYNTGKRSVTIDLRAERGRELFLAAVKTSHFVVETTLPGTLEEWGLGYERLKSVNPGLILVSITPYGQKGPCARHKASDLEVMAAGGLMSLIGPPERAPLRVTLPQSSMWAGMYAAMGATMAHYYRQVTGRGQHVDVSAQASVVWASAHGPAYWDLNRENIRRAGPFVTGRSVTGAKMRAIYPCRDGYLNFIIYGGPMGIRTNKNLARWMEEEGMASDALSRKDWDSFDITAVTQDEIDELERPIAEFFLTKTRKQFFEGALARNMLGYPVATAKDISEDPQLRERGFWTPLRHEQLGTHLTYPGGFGKFSETQCGPRRRAPDIGEHNDELYAELGVSGEERRRLREQGVI